MVVLPIEKFYDGTRMYSFGAAVEAIKIVLVYFKLLKNDLL